MELYQLEQFKTAAELSHITKAAELLSISQPALSKNIRALEKELGYPLFDHIGKHVQLNENGKILLRHVNDIFASIAGAKRELEDYNGRRSASISLCVKAASKLIPDILQNYNRRRPDVRFSLSQFSLPTEGSSQFDFTIEASLTPAAGPDSCTLLQEDLLLALPSGHRLAGGRDVDLSDLKDEPFISLQKGMGLSDIMNYYCGLCGFTPNIVFESDNAPTMRNLIHLGLGIAFIPKLTWPGLEDDTIRLLPIRGLNCRRYINLRWNSGRYLPAAALDFKEYLIQYFRELG